MMKRKLIKIKPRKKVSKKIKSKLVVLGQKKRFEEIKQEKKSEDLEEETEDDDFEFSSGFKLNSVGKLKGLENIRIGNSLEGGLIFAPRVRDRGKEGKNYSETKYEINYGGGKYGEKTPGDYGEKEPLPSADDPSNQ